MPYVDSSRTKTYYEIQGEGEPLVLIPGLMGDIYTWTNPRTPAFLQELKEEFQVIMYDPRCAGRTECPDGEFDYSEFVQDLRELLDHLGIDKVHLYGVSMGSVIATNFVVSYPEMVNRVVLACSAPSSDYFSEKARSLLRSLFKTNYTKTDMMRIYEFLLPAPVFEQQKPVLEQLLDKTRDYPRPTPDAYHRQLEATLEIPDNSQKLQELEQEFLILKPGYDPLIDPAGSDKLGELVANSMVIEYKNAIHEVLPKMPDPEMEPLISFLKGGISGMSDGA